MTADHGGLVPVSLSVIPTVSKQQAQKRRKNEGIQRGCQIQGLGPLFQQQLVTGTWGRSLSAPLHRRQVAGAEGAGGGGAGSGLCFASWPSPSGSAEGTFDGFLLTF